MNNSSYVKGDLLGKGSYAMVYKAQSTLGRKSVVFKEISIEGLPLREIRERLKEARFFFKLSSPHLITYYSHQVTSTCLTIILEYAPNGSLEQYLSQRNGVCLQEDEVLQYFSQVVHGLHYLHDNGIIHKDLTDRNILITGDWRVLKLCDLGVSSEVGETSNCYGAPSHFAPELCRGNSPSTSSDIWALGVLMYKMATLKLPFRGTTLSALAKAIVTSPLERLDKTRFSSLFQDLLEHLLSRIPGFRPTTKTLLSHPLCVKWIAALPTEPFMKPELQSTSEQEQDLLRYFLRKKARKSEENPALVARISPRRNVSSSEKPL